MPPEHNYTLDTQPKRPLDLKNAIHVLQARLLKLLDEFHQNGSAKQICRTEVPVEKTSLLAWLSTQNASTKIFWADRDTTFEMAGLGALHTVAADVNGDYRKIMKLMQDVLSQSHENIRFYGGLRFYKAMPSDSTWKKFGAYRFAIPEIELIRKGRDFFIACNYYKENPHRAFNLLKQLTHVDQPVHSLPKVISRADDPRQQEWARNINQALAAFNARQLEKVVLARKSTFAFEGELDPAYFIHTLRSANSKLFYFLFQFSENEAFLGGSPERLYLRKGRHIKSEAIAGTRPCGETPQQREQFGRNLLNCEKDVREHKFVVDSIKSIFREICDRVDIDDRTSLLQLSQVQHLRRRLQGVLRENIDDARIIEQMHPTPAVGGNPKEKAIACIRELEQFDRGWYAAPVGYIGRDEAEFVVAIRSGLLQGNTLSLFSGAGIVDGSEAANEWEEIENKISNFMKVIMSK